MTSVILDLDGTLVDSVPLHVVCWHDAFVAAGTPVPTNKLHAAIGLGSTRLVRHVLGTMPSADLEQQAINSHSQLFADRSDSLQPTPGATALLQDLADRAVSFVVATAAGSTERDRLLAILDDPDVDVVDNDDTADSKPAAGPLRAAMAKLDVRPGLDVTMVGDSPWDGYAAGQAGVRFLGVRCGGFAEATLLRAGATLLAQDPAGVIGLL